MLEVKVAEVSKALLDQLRHQLLARLRAGDGSMIRFLAGFFGGGAGSWADLGTAERRAAQLGRRVVGGTINGIPGVTGGNVTVTYDAAGRPTYTTTFGTVPGRA